MIIKKSIFFTLCLILISCNKKNIDSISSATWKSPNDVSSIAVEVLEIKYGKLIKNIETSGIISGSKEAWIVAESQGIIISKDIKLGQKVVKNQVIVTVENTLQKLNFNLYKELLEKAKKDFNTNKTAFENGNISRADFDINKINLLQAEAKFKQSSIELDKTYIKIPFNGEIALLEESIVTGNYLYIGTKIARVIDLSSFKMNLTLGARQVSLLKEGAKTLIFIESYNEIITFNGIVEAIGSGISPETGSFPVVISWINDNKTKIKSGLSAIAKIETNGESNQIIIPVTSLVIRNRKQGVFIEKNGKAYFKEVKTGQLFGGRIVVKSGLNINENIIISGLGSIGNEYHIDPVIVGNTGDWE